MSEISAVMVSILDLTSCTFIHSNEPTYVLSTNVLDTVLSAGNLSVNKTDKIPHLVEFRFKCRGQQIAAFLGLQPGFLWLAI